MWARTYKYSSCSECCVNREYAHGTMIQEWLKINVESRSTRIHNKQIPHLGLYEHFKSLKFTFIII